MARNNAVGARREQQVARLGMELGYMVSSLRHFAGPADQLWSPTRSGPVEVAISAEGGRLPLRPALIEVKGTLDAPWRSTWGPAARRAMKVAELTYGVEALLAWWPPNLSAPIWLPSEDWPADDGET